MNYNEAIEHFNKHGKFENRIYYMDKNFSKSEYLLLNNDLCILNDIELYKHYVYNKNNDIQV